MQSVPWLCRKVCCGQPALTLLQPQHIGLSYELVHQDIVQSVKRI